MKILYVATIGGFMPFFKSLINKLISEGHKVDIASNNSKYPLPEYYKEWGCDVYQISCLRTPLCKENLVAIIELKSIIQSNGYDVVHCHTPIAAACTRIACRKLRKNGLKVFYTAHGFHFFKGAPLKNWLLYYPVEKLLSRCTDMLITINREDYEIAQHKFRRIERIEYVPGVGVDVKKFINELVDKKEKRKELNIPEDAYILLSVGELNENKNHQLVIRALGEINDEKIHYVIAGKGYLDNKLKKISSDNGIEDRVHLIGYRTDIVELYKMSDAYILPSMREGLNVSLMEAMAAGLPCLASRIRGNIDLLDDNGGFLFSLNDVNEVKNAIRTVISLKDRVNMGVYNQSKIMKFDNEKVLDSIERIYTTIKQ